MISLSLTYLDEVILAHNLKTRADNPWSASRTALVLYTQNYKAFLKNAFFLAFIIWGMTFLIFLVCLLPADALASLFTDSGGVITILLALILAWGVKQAVIEPLDITALMQVLFTVTEGQTANPEWEAKLDKVSGKFSKLKEKSSEWASNPGGTHSPT